MDAQTYTIFIILFYQQPGLILRKSGKILLALRLQA